MKVAILHLVDGMELIGEVEDSGESVVVKKPCMIGMMGDGLALVPFEVPYATEDVDEKFTVRRDCVMYELTPTPQLESEYTKAVSNILVPQPGFSIE
jgi:hypothetical protein